MTSARSRTTVERVCEYCGVVFDARSDSFGRFCSLKCNGASKVVPIEKKFWHSVTKSESCWNWTGAKDLKGYGIIRFNNTTWRAHRLSYYLKYGQLPKGLFVCHSCDNPSCVKPSHLVLGTPQSNMDDMWQKGRGNPGHNKGTMNGISKLSERQVIEIREKRKTGLAYSNIAKEYGVAFGTVYQAVNGPNWSWFMGGR